MSPLTMSIRYHDPKITFPQRLLEMLEEAAENTNNDIISWMPHGQSFRVHNVNAFVATIMPTFFRQTKWPSFQRQLHIYGFKRISHGLDKGAYYHRFFRHEQPELAMLIKRSTIKGTKVRTPANQLLEPNFYSSPPSETSLLSASNNISILPRKRTKERRVCVLLIDTYFPMTSLLTEEFLDLPDDIAELEQLFNISDNDMDLCVDKLTGWYEDTSGWSQTMNTSKTNLQVQKTMPHTICARSA